MCCFPPCLCGFLSFFFFLPCSDIISPVHPRPLVNTVRLAHLFKVKRFTSEAFALKGVRSVCHPAGAWDYPPSWQRTSSPNLGNILHRRPVIKQSSCLFIPSLKPDIINTGAELSRTGVLNVSKLLVTSFLFFAEILHEMDFALVPRRSLKSVSDMHKYARKMILLQDPVCLHEPLCVCFNLAAVSIKQVGGFALWGFECRISFWCCPQFWRGDYRAQWLLRSQNLGNGH